MFSDTIWWWDVRHFENGFIGISQPGIIRFWWHLKSWCADSNFGSKNGHMLIYKIYEIQNGGQLPYWKSFFAISPWIIVRCTHTTYTHSVRVLCVVCVIHRRVIVFLNESQLLALQPSEPVTLLNECAVTCSIHALARVTAVSPDTIAIQYRTAVIPHSSDVSM